MIDTWKPYVHRYKEFDSYALMFSLTTHGLSIQIGPAQAHDGQACELRMRSERMQPPIGLSPRNIAETAFSKQRADEILEAMRRYSDADMAIPREWLDELTERLEHVNT